MSGETLRRAAALMREHGARGLAWEEPWDGDAAADKGWLAPTVALAVADLLDEIALRWDYVEERELALAVARAYLGETP